MSGVNKVLLIGRIGRDPETKYTPDGTCITNLSVATSERWKDKATGEKQEKTEWHRVKAFGKLAEIAAEYFHKGNMVYVEGKLETREYEKNGEKRYSTEIRAIGLENLSPRESGASSEDRPSRPPQQRAPSSPPSDMEDDIPF